MVIMRLKKKDIFDAMAKSLNIEKIAKIFDNEGEEETHS